MIRNDLYHNYIPILEKDGLWNGLGNHFRGLSRSYITGDLSFLVDSSSVCMYVLACIWCFFHAITELNLLHNVFNYI